MRMTVLTLLSVVAVSATTTLAEAQSHRVTTGEPLVLRVQPRSFLNPGTVVQTGELNRGASALTQTQSYLNMPPWIGQRERFGEGVLPDPVVGPFVGARNPIGPVDFVAPQGLR